jgi:hypothetical protein
MRPRHAPDTHVKGFRATSLFVSKRTESHNQQQFSVQFRPMLRLVRNVLLSPMCAVLMPRVVSSAIGTENTPLRFVTSTPDSRNSGYINCTAAVEWIHLTFAPPSTVPVARNRPHKCLCPAVPRSAACNPANAPSLSKGVGHMRLRPATSK